MDQRIILPEGTIKDLHVVGHPVLNQSADVIEFVGTSIDVAEAKQLKLRAHAFAETQIECLSQRKAPLTKVGPDDVADGGSLTINYCRPGGAQKLRAVGTPIRPSSHLTQE